MGIHYAHEALADPLVRGFLEKVEREEIIPTVPSPPDTDLDEYFARVLERFGNPKIADTVPRLCFDGSNRQPKFIIPSISDRLKAGADVEGLALVSALWCRYCFGTTDSGEAIEANDPNWDRLVSVARAARDDPAAWLSMNDIYGDVGRSAVFRERFSAALLALWSDGVEAVMTRYLEALH